MSKLESLLPPFPQYYLKKVLFTPALLLCNLGQAQELLDIAIQKLDPERISTEFVEYASTFNTEGTELYFARSRQKWAKEELKSTIYFSKKENGSWSTPQIASFSGEFDDSDPHLTGDGNSLYYISKRPPNSADIYVVHKATDGIWGAPQRLNDSINSSGTEYSPRTDAIGNLYFASDGLRGYGQGDLYVCRFRNSRFQAPENLGNTVNSKFGEWNLEISQDGKILIFEASQRKENVSPYGDLYLSFKQKGNWTIPQNIKELNSSGSDLCPYLSPDLKTLYYSSSDSLKSTGTNIYQADFSKLSQAYRERAKLPEQLLFSVNRSAHSVSIINANSKTLLHTIDTGKGPHEVAVTGDGNWAFVANYGFFPKPHEGAITPQQLQWQEEQENSVTKINLEDYSTQTFSLGSETSPHGILTNYDGSLVWVSDEGQGAVIEMDGNKGTILKSYKTMPGTHIVKGNRERTKLFASNIESNSISVIDLGTGEIQNISTPKGPEGMELNPNETELWVLCNSANQVLILDLETLKPIHSFESRGKFPVKLTFVNEEAWISNVFSKNIAIFNTETYAFKEEISLESTPLGIDSSRGKVFVTLPRLNTIREIDAQSRETEHNYQYGMEQDGLTLINTPVYKE